MTTEEILRIESLNATGIHFILEGTFWHVYERSAFLTFTYLKELKMTRKYIKAVGRDIVYGGFPKDRLADLLEKSVTIGAFVVEQSAKRCSVLGFPETPGFDLWREGWTLKEKTSASTSDNLPVYKAIYDLLTTLFVQVRNFPRDYQYTLGERIKNSTIELTEMVYYANTCGDVSEKISYLKTLCAKVETLRLLLRMCYDLRLYNLETHLRFNDQIELVARQMAGWRKQVLQVADSRRSKEEVPEPVVVEMQEEDIPF